jgi:hypothetical protein
VPPVVFSSVKPTIFLHVFKIFLFLPQVVKTPSGHDYVGAELALPLCGVALIRGGESMEVPLRSVARDVAFGKMLVRKVCSSHVLFTCYDIFISPVLSIEIQCFEWIEMDHLCLLRTRVRALSCTTNCQVTLRPVAFCFSMPCWQAEHRL